MTEQQPSKSYARLTWFFVALAGAVVLVLGLVQDDGFKIATGSLIAILVGGVLLLLWYRDRR